MTDSQFKKQQILTYGDLINSARGFMESMTMLTAMELDVFTIIDSGELASGEICKQIGANEQAVDRLLNAVCAMGVLRKEKGRFLNVSSLAPFLVKDSENYFGGYRHLLNLYYRWGTLPEAVQKGARVAGQGGDGEGSTEAFIAAMHSRARITAPAVVSKIDCAGVKRLLDVGGGLGIFSMAFARAHDSISAVVFDLPEMVELTREDIDREGLSDRISTLAGDYHRNDFGSGFDLLFLSAIVHINSYDENMALIKKSFRALNPGGKIVVQDFIMENDRTRPRRGALFALNKLVNTVQGDTFTGSEITDWLKSAGCHEVTWIERGEDTSLIIGEKPAE